MALNGSVTTSSYSGRSMTLNWSATQSVANNTSTISWSLVGSGSESGWVRCGGFYVNIGGNVVCNWDTNTRVQVYPNTVVASGTTTLSHNADGTKSFSISVQAGIYEYTRNCSGSGSFTLNTIARASEVMISNGGVVLGTYCVVGANSASSSFKHTFTYKFGSLSGTIATNVSGTGWLYKEWTPPASFSEQVTNAVEGWGTITCTTYSGSTVVGTKSVNFYGIVPDSAVPTVSTATVAADNSANSVIKGWGLWVAGYTKAKITAAASGIYNSTISGFNISGGASASVTGSSLDYTTGAINTTGDITFSVTATDSRGRTSEAVSTSAVTVYPYSVPKITSFSAQRSSSDDTKVIVEADWEFASVDSKNAATATLYYKKASATSWTTYGTISKNASVTLTATFEEESSYNFRLIVTDSVGNSAQEDSLISTGAALMDYRTGGKGIAFGKMAESDNLVDINQSWDFNVHGLEILDLIDNAIPTIPTITVSGTTIVITTT